MNPANENVSRESEEALVADNPIQETAQLTHMSEFELARQMSKTWSMEQE